MIVAVGFDLVDLPGFRTQLEDGASCFAERTYTARERAQAHRPGKDPVRSLAARFAAKEAFVKAWSALRQGEPPLLPDLDWREVEVALDAWGRPSLLLHGSVARAVTALGALRWHISLSHDGPTAGAVVVAERLPSGDADPEAGDA